MGICPVFASFSVQDISHSSRQARPSFSCNTAFLPGYLSRKHIPGLYNNNSMLENIRHLIRHGRQAAESRANSNESVQTNNDSTRNANITTNTHAKELAHDNTNMSISTNSSIVSHATTSTTNEHRNHNHHRRHHNHHQHSTHEDSNHPHEHHANELKPVAQNIVMQESMDENKRQQASRKSIERYRMGPVLGEGAFSVVYSAVDLLTREKVAIKIIKKYQLDEKQRNSVLKEVNIMKLLNHPNIVKLIDFIENDDYYYIIQEVVSGGEVFNQIVKFTYFSEDLSRHVIVQVAEALLYMHEQVGIVHRDLKPENIFFKPIKIIKEDQKTRIAKLRKSDNPGSKIDEGKFIMNYGGGGIGLIKIGDFGLSKQISLNSNDSSLKTPCGTVGYTAPEIVRDMRYSKEVDMWALGCVLYILLCGFPPFFNDSIEELTKTVAKGDFKFLAPWWNEISSGAKHCVSKLLTVNPMHRYTVEQFLKDPWILEFLNRSENIQTHEKLKKKVQQRQFAGSSNELSSTASASSRSTSVPTTTTGADTMISSSNSSTVTNKSKDEALSTNMKRDTSGMPGFELGADISGNAESKKIPLNTYPSVYSQSVVDLHKIKKQKSKSRKNSLLHTGSSEMDIDKATPEIEEEDDEDMDGEDELSDEDESMTEETSIDENSDESIGGFDDRHRSSVSEAIPMLEHVLDPAPASEFLREDHSSDKVQIETTGEIKKSNKKNNKKHFTPEVKAMKDMYDISIAARRMHEEAQYTPGGMNSVVGFNDLNILEENEDDSGVVHGGVTQVSVGHGSSTASNTSRISNNNAANMFTLNINDATILARRQKKRKAIVV